MARMQNKAMCSFLCLIGERVGITNKEKNKILEADIHMKAV